MSYTRFIAHHPVWMMVLVGLVATICLVISALSSNTIDFSDPKAGFGTRGTVISDRLRSLRRLLDVTRRDVRETSMPFGHPRDMSHQLADDTTALDDDDDHTLENDRKPSVKMIGNDTFTSQQHDYKWLTTGTNKFFCSDHLSDGINMARVVYKHAHGENLFSASSIRSMCRLEDTLFRNCSGFSRICLKPGADDTGPCCNSQSLGNYVALLTNKSSCQQVNNEDVNYVRQILVQCSPFYYNFTLDFNCDSFGSCVAVPEVCKRHNAVYVLLHYITDSDFINSTPANAPFLTYAISFLPASTGQAMVDIYTDLIAKTLHNEDTQVVALNFGIKYMLFDHYLKLDAVWIGASAAAVFLSIWIYAASIFVTTISVVAVAFSLVIAYFTYTVIFGIHFFPFMNLLTVVIAIGIGADDVLVFCKVWMTCKSERNNGTLEKIVSNTLKHATVSMFVTSFTTAAAFYANFVSDIVAVRCFAVYAGTTVLANFVIMMTWIPAAIVIQEKWCSCCVFYSPDIYVQKPNLFHYICEIMHSAHKYFLESSRIFFEKLLPCIVIKLRFLWLFIMIVLTIGGGLVVFHHPKLKLPTSNEFKVFSSSNLFEVYDSMIRDRFLFEKGSGLSMPMMPLTIVWGIVPRDDGDRLDPLSEPTLRLDKTFNLTTKAAQKWLMGFCQRLRQVEFHSGGPSLHVSNCFIETFRHLFMERRCQINGEDLEPCCNKHTFPYPEPVFIECLRRFGPEINRLSFSHPTAGPRYSKEDSRMIALIVEFSSKKPFTYSYPEIDVFYHSMDQWTRLQMAAAPAEMSNGWFTSEVEFYDLQHSISLGTRLAIGVSVVTASLVLFLTTLNVLISICAMVSIVSTISITVGALVLLGWELGILESTTISVAVGLSIDFTLHYGVAYRLSPDLDRETRVVCSLQRIGTPVAVAAFTTFLAGSLMLPSTVLAYRHIGTFLMIVMATSWFSATFFFQSLLRLIGPLGGFGQFHWPRSDCCKSTEPERVDKTIYSMSESTMSSSSANHVPANEIYELEPLTTHSWQRRRSRMNQFSNDRRKASMSSARGSISDQDNWRYRKASHVTRSRDTSVSTMEEQDKPDPAPRSIRTSVDERRIVSPVITDDFFPDTFDDVDWVKCSGVVARAVTDRNQMVVRPVTDHNQIVG